MKDAVFQALETLAEYAGGVRTMNPPSVEVTIRDCSVEHLRFIADGFGLPVAERIVGTMLLTSTSFHGVAGRRLVLHLEAARKATRGELEAAHAKAMAEVGR